MSGSWGFGENDPILSALNSRYFEFIKPEKGAKYYSRSIYELQQYILRQPNLRPVSFKVFLR